MGFAWPTTQRMKKPEQIMGVGRFPFGLNTSVPAQQLSTKELSECINWKFKANGRIETRSGLVKYSSSTTTNSASIKTIAKASIGGTAYTLLVDENHVLYYLDANKDPVSVGTLEGDATIVAYNDVAVILDGGYIKYLDNVSTIKIAYDDGNGTSGYQFDYTGNDDDSAINLGDGTNSRVAVKFTSQDWTSGYTVPPTTITAILSKTGSPTGTIIAKLRKVSDDSEIASKDMIDVSELGTSSSQYSVTFSSSDITTEMSPSTEYYCSLEYSGGDGSNYVNVRCTNVSSGGVAYYYTTSWNNDSTKHPLMSLRPGKPPKGSFGKVYKSRLFVAGDPDNPGYLWYSNLTYLDWSSTDGGGYIGILDSSNANYPINGLETLYGNLYVFGGEQQPYVCVLTGSDPTDFAVALLFSAPWAVYSTVVNTGNDVWFASAYGVQSLYGVKEYGDIRVFTTSHAISDKIEDYWDSDTAIAEFYPADGQYWLVMPSYHRVLVSHPRLPAQDNLSVRYPWTEYEFYKAILSSEDDFKWTQSSNGTNEYYLEAAGGGDPGITEPDALSLDGLRLKTGTIGSLSAHEWAWGDNDGLGYNTVYFRSSGGDPNDDGEIRSLLIPSALCSIGDDMYVGGTDGYLYVMDQSAYKDMDSWQVKPRVKTSYLVQAFNAVNITDFQLMLYSKTGGRVNVKFYVDDAISSEAISKSMSIYDNITVDELDGIDVIDAWFNISASGQVAGVSSQVNINAYSVMVGIEVTTVTSYSVFLDNIILRYRGLSW